MKLYVLQCMSYECEWMYYYIASLIGVFSSIDKAKENAIVTDDHNNWLRYFEIVECSLDGSDQKVIWRQEVKWNWDKIKQNHFPECKEWKEITKEEERDLNGYDDM